MPESDHKYGRNWPDGWLLGLLRSSGRLTRAHEERLHTSREASLWSASVQCGVIADDELTELVAQRFRVPLAVLSELEGEVASQLPEAFAREHGVAPLRLDGRVLVVACSDPVNPELESAIRFRAGRNVSLRLASPARIQDMLKRLYPGTDAITAAVRSMEPALQRGVLQRPASQTARVQEYPMVQLVDALIGQGIRRRASDIHLEPDSGAVCVRYRIDGVLHEVTRLPIGTLPPLVSRVKVMANLDIADRLRPQDGRGEARIDGKRVDLRVSTMPVGTVGEKVVIRILDSGTSVQTLTHLGYSSPELHRVERVLLGEEGLVLVTGPTGSGKTTTLYSGLRTLQRASINIVTVEDPIEYRLPGIAQVQVNEAIGLTFASALRSLLRQDPDVILVGEIRDAETAQIAVQASLTGHRVLTTLHTPDAPSAVSRMLGLGSDRSALASALKGVVAQRLVRRLCPECRMPVDLGDLPEPQRVLLRNTDVAQLYHAVGCGACGELGYHGRMAVTQIAIVTPTVARAIARGATEEELTKLCRSAGMRSLWESGLDRVFAGETTLQELIETVPPPVNLSEDDAGAVEHVLTQREVDALLDSLRAPRTGATVIELPRAPVPPREPEPQLPEIEPVSTIMLRPPAYPGDKPLRPRILIADDDRAVRQLFRRSLERAGADVVEATDGQLALEFLSSAEFDLALLDLTMPKEDGFGVLRAMREGRVREVPVVIVTGHADPEVAAWAREMGASDVVTKPIEPRVLAARVGSLLNLQAA